VGVGHQRDVQVHEWHGCGLHPLLDGVVIDL
jgi:hypothetical protein